LIEEKLMKENAMVTPIIYSPPIHSPLMNEYRKEFYDFLSSIKYHSFRIPIVSNVTGDPFSEPSMIPYIMSEQLVKPVQWNKTMICFEKYGISMVVENGPKNLLTSFFNNIETNMKKYCFGIKKDREEISNLFLNDKSLQKDKVRFLDRCLGIAVATQNLNDNPEQFQAGVVDSYNNIKKLSKQVNDANRMPDIKEMQQATQYLIRIMETKKIPIDEQHDWLKQLFDETSTYYHLSEFIY
jgi:[acyl-carrier-protein] S-malonyltransferase